MGAGSRPPERGADAAEEFDRIVDLLGIGPLLDRRPGTCRAARHSAWPSAGRCCRGPALLLADEPLAALDANRKEEILPYFERLRDDLQVPILYVSHAAPEVARLATTVVVLEDGARLRSGPAAEVLGDPDVRRWAPGTRVRFWRRGWCAITRTG
jgi:molybdate transport system ATP-binding protein